MKSYNAYFKGMVEGGPLGALLSLSAANPELSLPTTVPPGSVTVVSMSPLPEL